MPRRFRNRAQNRAGASAPAGNPAGTCVRRGAEDGATDGSERLLRAAGPLRMMTADPRPPPHHERRPMFESRPRDMAMNPTDDLPGDGVVSSDAYFAEVYDRLKAMASRHRARGGSPPTLCTTEIVHELYLRMEHSGRDSFGHGIQFFAYAARAMRSIMVDFARQRQRFKKGGGQARLSLTDPAVGVVQVDAMLALALDEGLRKLEAEDPRAASVVELHFFAGLDLARVGELLGIARRTVDRDWRFARAFLAAYAGGDRGW